MNSNYSRSAGRLSGARRVLLMVALLATNWSGSVVSAAPVVTQAGPYAWVAQEMTEIRELPLLYEVKERHITREEFRVELEDDELADEIRADVGSSERTMKALGLIPEGADLFALLQDVYATGVAGYYDPEANEMIVVSDSGSSDAFAQITYAHEFVHALTDQHFDLEALQKQVDRLDDEADMAFHALVEGDATAAQLEFMTQNLDLLKDADFTG